MATPSYKEPVAKNRNLEMDKDEEIGIKNFMEQ
jgi:hypothetical protein